MQIPILYEDNHFIAVNKPAGVPVQPDQSGDPSLLDVVKDYIKEKYNKPGDVFLGLPHRLDRPVSGVMLLARTSKGLARINDLFKYRKIKKVYWMLSKTPAKQESGTLTNWLSKHPKTFKAHVHEKQKNNAKKAVLDYRLIAKLGGKHLFEIELHTGRHHQIRAQMAHIGCPIIGDQKYGYQRGNRDRSICLHARKMEFIHPVKNEPVVIEARLPENVFWEDFRHIES